MGCEIKREAVLGGVGSLQSAPTRKEAKGFVYPLPVSGVNCISAVTSFPLTEFPPTLWEVPTSKPH